MSVLHEKKKHLARTLQSRNERASGVALFDGENYASRRVARTKSQFVKPPVISLEKRQEINKKRREKWLSKAGERWEKREARTMKAKAARDARKV